MSEMTREKILGELGFSPAKTKTPQAETPKEAQNRDLFQTPNYATDLLIPFIPDDILTFWECAAGNRKIADRLEEGTNKFVYCTDIRPNISNWVFEHNFLTEVPALIQAKIEGNLKFCIITNPPFSLKKKFYERCREFDMPFALLIPADYSGWIIQAIMDGAEKIIPTRRIDYITPSGLSGATGHSSDFHSMWLTWGFGLGSTEIFVDLPIEWKKENI